MTLAILGALCIGISLGLLGSGGSILTVPVLVYILHHGEKPAMAESLAIVGAIALIGATQYSLKKLIDWRSVIYFGLPGMGGAYLGAFAAGYIPGAVLLAIFGLFMLLASYMMLRPIRMDSTPHAETPRPVWKIVLEGVSVGAITGMVGAGGGFLIIPALVLLGGLRMHVAVGTSLVIIALKSAAGFVKYLDVVRAENLQVDWFVIGLFIAVGGAGNFAGQYLAGRINQGTLRRIFGIFLIVMAVYILIKQAVSLASAVQ